MTDSHIVFKESKYIPKTPSFVESKGYLYLVDDTGSLTCRDAKSGALKWREKIPGNFSSSPVLVGDRLYLATEDGVVSRSWPYGRRHSGPLGLTVDPSRPGGMAHRPRKQGAHHYAPRAVPAIARG